MSTITSTTARKTARTRKPSTGVKKVVVPVEVETEWMLRPSVTQVTSLWDTTPHLIHDVNGTCFRIVPTDLSVKDLPWLTKAFSEEMARAAADPEDRVHLFCERCCVERRNSIHQVKVAKRAVRDEVVTRLVEIVKAHAMSHYAENGWDYVVETMSDADIAALIGSARTEDGAINKVGIVVDEYHSRRAEIDAEIAEGI